MEAQSRIDIFFRMWLLGLGMVRCNRNSNIYCYCYVNCLTENVKILLYVINKYYKEDSKNIRKCYEYPNIRKIGENLIQIYLLSDFGMFGSLQLSVHMSSSVVLGHPVNLQFLFNRNDL